MQKHSHSRPPDIKTVITSGFVARPGRESVFVPDVMYRRRAESVLTWIRSTLSRKGKRASGPEIAARLAEKSGEEANVFFKKAAKKLYPEVASFEPGTTVDELADVYSALVLEGIRQAIPENVWFPACRQIVRTWATEVCPADRNASSDMSYTATRDKLALIDRLHESIMAEYANPSIGLSAPDSEAAMNDHTQAGRPVPASEVLGGTIKPATSPRAKFSATVTDLANQPPPSWGAVAPRPQTAPTGTPTPASTFNPAPTVQYASVDGELYTLPVSDALTLLAHAMAETAKGGDPGTVLRAATKLVIKDVNGKTVWPPKEPALAPAPPPISNGISLEG